MRLLPEGSFPVSRESERATLPSALSCTTWGFSYDLAYAKIRWALTPPFHPYPSPPVASGHCQLPVKSTKVRGNRRLLALETSDLLFISNEPTTDADYWQLMVLGGLFSVTLSVT
jgi:hypothetical protein